MPRAPGDRGLFPPQETTLVKALACERPTDRGRPLSRLSVFDVCQAAWEQGATMSYSTVWRRLHEDALRPWFHRPWLFPRDPRLRERAAPVLDLYQRRWQGKRLGKHDVVLSADELTQLQALSHQPTVPPGPGQAGLYEFEYVRHGTLCYLAFLDVFSGRVYGEITAQNGIVPFDRALQHCLAQERYRDAERVFLIVDNGCAHHPSTAPARLQALDERLIVVHLPVHASWLNQVELYFSILKRKALQPADFPDLHALKRRVMLFQVRYNEHAEPFTWNYTRRDLAAYLQRLKQRGWFPPPANPLPN
jgi:DDE superfamily endonuclease